MNDNWAKLLLLPFVIVWPESRKLCWILVATICNFLTWWTTIELNPSGNRLSLFGRMNDKWTKSWWQSFVTFWPDERQLNWILVAIVCHYLGWWTTIELNPGGHHLFFFGLVKDNWVKFWWQSFVICFAWRATIELNSGGNHLLLFYVMGDNWI